MRLRAGSRTNRKMCCNVFILPPKLFHATHRLLVDDGGQAGQQTCRWNGVIRPGAEFRLSLPCQWSARVPWSPRSLTRCGPCSTNVNACAQPGMASSRSDCLARQGASRSVSSRPSWAPYRIRTKARDQALDKPRNNSFWSDKASVSVYRSNAMICCVE